MRNRALAAGLFAGAAVLFFLAYGIVDGHVMDMVRAWEVWSFGIAGAAVVGALAAPWMARVAARRSAAWGLLVGGAVTLGAFVVGVVLLSVVPALPGVPSGEFSLADVGQSFLYALFFGAVLLLPSLPFGALAGVFFFAILRHRAWLAGDLDPSDPSSET